MLEGVSQFVSKSYKMYKLKLHYTVFLWICSIIYLSTETSSKKVKELKVITEYMPEDCGLVAEDGDEIKVHYTGSLDTGVVFDTSLQADRGPLPFTLGRSQVIRGWEEGIRGMCVGEKRKLIIPSHLAYGAQGHPPAIPPDATLTFQTELIDVQKKAAKPEFVFRMLWFLAIPFVVGYAIYYLYDKYKNAPTKKDMKAAAAKGRRKNH